MGSGGSIYSVYKEQFSYGEPITVDLSWIPRIDRHLKGWDCGGKVDLGDAKSYWDSKKMSIRELKKPMAILMRNPAKIWGFYPSLFEAINDENLNKKIVVLKVKESKTLVRYLTFWFLRYDLFLDKKWSKVIDFEMCYLHHTKRLMNKIAKANEGNKILILGDLQ